MLVLIERAPIGYGEIVAALAVTTAAAKELNNELTRFVPNDNWRVIAAADWKVQQPEKWKRRDRIWRAKEFADWASKTHYRGLKISPAQATAAFKQVP